MASLSAIALTTTVWEQIAFQYGRILRLCTGRSAAWLAHLPWAQGVGGSNPLAPITTTRFTSLAYGSCSIHELGAVADNSADWKREVFMSRPKEGLADPADSPTSEQCVVQ